MADFRRYAPLLKQFEGGFVNHPDDPGGANNMGVTLATFRQFFGANKTVMDLRMMNDTQWTTIMKGGYWDKCLADQIRNQSVAELIVDWCVNSGTGIIRKVQGIVGVTADGIVGQRTIAAINRADAQNLHFRIKRARAEYYATLVDNRKSNLTFYDGWFSRLSQLKFKRV